MPRGAYDAWALEAESRPSGKWSANRRGRTRSMVRGAVGRIGSQEGKPSTREAADASHADLTHGSGRIVTFPQDGEGRNLTRYRH